MSDARQVEMARRIVARFGTPAGTGVEAVSAAATTLTVTFDRGEGDVSYGVVATASWGTTVFVSSKATGSFALGFGTAAPGGGGSVNWVVFRTEN